MPACKMLHARYVGSDKRSLGRYLTKNKTTVAICDSGSNGLRQPKSTFCKYVGHVSHICFFLFQTHPP